MDISSSSATFLITFGWVGIIVGILFGGFLSSYAFSGPFKPPKGHEDYTSLPRRMLRLSHIAAVMLPLISIIYGMHLDSSNLSSDLKYIGAMSMVVFSIGIPSLLALSCFYLPIKYVQVIPISAGLLALRLMAWGYLSFYI